MKASPNNYVSEEKVVSSPTYNFARFGLLFLVPLLAFCLARGVRYDIPNLSQEWRPARGGLSNAVAFLGGTEKPRVGLREAYIGTLDGKIYTIDLGGARQVGTVPEVSQQILAKHQGRRPLIPYTLVSPPGEIVDYYKSSRFTGSMLDSIVAHYVILDDGTIWEWMPVADDLDLLGMQIVGGIYALITLLTVLVLLRLGRLWTGTWFWRTAVKSQPELVRRTILSAIASLIPGIALIGLFSLFEPYQVELTVMALLVAVMTVPCVIFIRKKTVAVLVSAFVPVGVFIWIIGFYDWLLGIYLQALVIGLLTSLATIGLIDFSRRTTAVSAV